MPAKPTKKGLPVTIIKLMAEPAVYPEEEVSPAITYPAAYYVPPPKEVAVIPAVTYPTAYVSETTVKAETAPEKPSGIESILMREREPTPEELGFKPMTAEEQEHALQLAVKKGVVYYELPLKQVEKEGKVVGYAETPTGTLTYYMYKKKPTATEQILKGEAVWKTGARLHMGPKIYEMTPEEQRKALAISYPVREFSAGLVGVAEAWIRPEVKTPSGEAIGRLLTGKPTGYETGELSPYYLIGGVTGTVFETALFTTGISKATGLIKKIPVVARTTAKISQSYHASRLAKYVYQAEMKVKFVEPIYTIRTIPSKIETWFAKQFPSATGKIELALGWGGEKWLLPSGFETWATTVEAHKFVGYPIIYGKYAGYGIIQVTKPTAFQQIMFRVEKGMYPAMGGLSARQVAIFEKPTAKTTWLMRTLTFPAVAETRKAGAKTISMFMAATLLQLPKLATPKYKAKTFSPTLTLPKFELPSFEREKEKFKTLTLETLMPKEKTRLIPIPKVSLTQIQPQLPKLESITQQKEKLVSVQVPKLAQLTKSVQKQTQKLVSKTTYPPQQIQKLAFPTPAYYKPKIPDISKIGKGLRGEWFKREHPIITPAQLAKEFGFSMPKKRGKRKRRKRK